MKIKITHLYPDLLNLYGDKGNIEVLRHRLVWRGYDVEVVPHTMESGKLDLSCTDILYLGGGADREERLALESLREYKDNIRAYVEAGKTLLALCGGFMMLGKNYHSGDEMVDGLDILDITSEKSDKRFSGDIVIKSDCIDYTIVGFENHGTKTDIGMYGALGTVLQGMGNNGEDKTEGLVYKNVIATHIHGPLLPKNPKLCDYILLNTLRAKGEELDALTELDDKTEMRAHEFILRRYEI